MQKGESAFIGTNPLVKCSAVCYTIFSKFKMAFGLLLLNQAIPNNDSRKKCAFYKMRVILRSCYLFGIFYCKKWGRTNQGGCQKDFKQQCHHIK